MKKVIIFLSIFVFIFQGLECQNYIPFLHAYNEMIRTKDNISDFKDLVYSTDYPQPFVYSEILFKGGTKNDSSLVAECFKRLVLSGYALKDFYSRGWMDVKNKQIKLYTPIFEKGKDTALISKIKIMLDNDQLARGDTVPIEEMVRVDSINHIEIVKMIKEFGKIPGIKELGNKGMENILLMLRHLEGDTNLFNFLYPYLIKQVKEGDFPPHAIASLIDYYWWANFIRIDSTKAISYQLYGIAELKYHDGCLIKVPVRDWNETNRLRKEIGLESLEEELKNNPNVFYDFELFKQKYNMFQE